MPNHYPSLNPHKALIWRIIHRDNLPWVLDNGLHSGNSPVKAPHWVSIGNQELIDKRAQHVVPVPPGGYFNDYVPFYFTPFSVMMKNIHSGRSVQQRRNDEILILVSSLHHVAAQGLRFLFTDSHAFYQWAHFYDSLEDLGHVDWPLLQSRDFKRDPDDPAKFERYQAEALVHQLCPVAGLLGIVCYTDALKTQVAQQLAQRGLNLPVYARTNWYF
ncbi:hypothetical protein os1_22750 [Comamonadaceae bacterium OS-1]|nr:hypothetical protein os1_22750 [Comamonadaceae bacterium OS-1]